MRRKIIDEYSLSYLNDLFKTKLIIYDPSRIFTIRVVYLRSESYIYDPSRILQHSELVWTLSSV